MSELADLDEALRLKRDTLRWPLRAKVVLENYRLKAHDLRGDSGTDDPGNARGSLQSTLFGKLQSRSFGRQNYFRTQVVNVSLEGVEELSVLLHLADLAKPLRLTHQQRQEMALMFDSQNFADWIGRSLALTILPSPSQSAEVNHIELTLIDGRRAPHTHPAKTLNNETTVTEEFGSTAATNQSPVRTELERVESAGNRTDVRRPYTHFSGVGQEFSIEDPSMASGRERFTRPRQPSWLRNLGQSAIFKQAQVLLGPNFLIALILFLLVVGFVQFERIAEWIAFLLP